MLYEKLLKNPKLANQTINPRLFTEYLTRATVFNIQNVSDYYWTDSPKNEWMETKDFPNIAPPFEYFWMEYKGPKIINIDNEFVKPKFPSLPIGYLIEAHKTDEVEPDKIFNTTDFKWIMNVNVFLDTKIRGVVRLYGMDLAIRPDGVLGKIDDKLAIRTYLPEEFTQNPTNQELIQGGIMSPLHPVLLALSFMHCKNVTPIVTDKIKKPRQLHQSKTEPKIKVYTLEIEPMKKILREEGQSEKTGIKHALHICRGHFKDFRERGLFGKYHGIYWWDNQVRGNKKYGEVIKDYEIKSPS